MLGRPPVVPSARASCPRTIVNVIDRTPFFLTLFPLSHLQILLEPPRTRTISGSRESASILGSFRSCRSLISRILGHHRIYGFSRFFPALPFFSPRTINVLSESPIERDDRSCLPAVPSRVASSSSSSSSSSPLEDDRRRSPRRSPIDTPAADARRCDAAMRVFTGATWLSVS